MKQKKLYIYNGIENQLEEISDLKEAKEYIKDYIEYGDIHPDIESIIILEEVGGVTVDETGEETKLNGDIVPVCKVDVFLNNDNKEIEEILKKVWEMACTAQMNLVYEHCTNSPNGTNGHAIKFWVKQAEFILPMLTSGV